MSERAAIVVVGALGARPSIETGRRVTGIRLEPSREVTAVETDAGGPGVGLFGARVDTTPVRGSDRSFGAGRLGIGRPLAPVRAVAP